MDEVDKITDPKIVSAVMAAGVPLVRIQANFNGRFFVEFYFSRRLARPIMDSLFHGQLVQPTHLLFEAQGKIKHLINQQKLAIPGDSNVPESSSSPK